MNLIHDAKYFTKKEILRRARKYEFPNPLAVEIFLWDCELAAQLQDACSDVVLKGGAAAQLHLPLEKQRGSIDIDVATSLKKSDVDEVIQKVGRSLEGTIEFKLHKPENPCQDTRAMWTAMSISKLHQEDPKPLQEVEKHG